MRTIPLFSVLTAFLAFGCGGSGGGSATKSLSITPGLVSVEVGRSVQFTAVPQGGVEPITWAIVSGGGSISAAGLYTAPSVPGTYQVQASVKNKPSVSAFATIQVVAGVTVSVSGTASKVVLTRSRLALTASVVGSANQNVAWSVPAGSSSGTVSSDGVYTAPAAAGTYTVRARSLADPSKFADINVTVAATAKVRLTIAGKGDIDILMRADKAPNTCANMVSLTNEAFYDLTKFHRREDLNTSNSVPDFIVQGGDPLSRELPESDDGTGGPGYTIPFETNDLTHERYRVAMARSADRDSGGSQFYICQDPVHFLDSNYVVFGEVVAGQAIVDSLRKGDTITRAVTIP